MRPVFLTCLLLAAIISGCEAAGGGRKLGQVGGWTPIKNVSDPQVQEIASFAVTEHNKEAGTSLKLIRVVRGETQVVAGTNYRLVIAAGAGGIAKHYEAVVWDKPWEKFRKLTSFTPLNP